MNTSDLGRIAERYVRALFEVARDASAVETVESDLTGLGDALESSEELCHFLTNPLLTREVQTQTMSAILAKMGAHPITDQFITMLAAQKRLAVLPEIIALFKKWAEHSRGEIRAEVISAVKLGVKEAKTVADQLSKSVGKKVNLEVSQNPELLGGMVVKMGGLQLDSSVAGKLDRLKQILRVA